MQASGYRTNHLIATALFLLAILCSLVSQAPSILDAGADQPLKVVWALPFVYLFFTTPNCFVSNRLVPLYFFAIAFALFCFAGQMFTGRKYLSDDLYNILISTMITSTSFCFWIHNGGKSLMRQISALMLLCGLALSVNLYATYLLGSDITTTQYAYGEKNSIAQILLCCGFIGLAFYSPREKVLYWASRLTAVVIFVVMVMTRSRATLLSGAYIVYYFVFKSDNKKLKWWTIGLSIIGLLYFFFNENIYDVILNGIILGGRDANDLNSLSSNRLVAFMIALQQIPQHPWVGSGDYYVDCMPLNILTQYGICGLSIIFLFLYYMFHKLKRAKQEDYIATMTYILFFAFFINSLLEARPPFGPGVRSFTLWMMFGFSLAQLLERETANPVSNVYDESSRSKDTAQ